MEKKEVMSESAMKALLMKRVRQLPDCDNVIDVAITRPAESNWDAGWVHEGHRVAGPEAWKLVAEMRRKFDVSKD